VDNFQSLDDIFADEDFADLVKDVLPKKVELVDKEVEDFLEILEWAKANGGKEPEKSRDMKERKLAARLKGIRAKAERSAKLKPYDELNWLEGVEEQPEPDVELSFDEILDDPMFLTNEKESSLFDVSRYKRTIDSRDKMSVRKRVNADFSVFNAQFKQVHAEIASGERKLVNFEGNLIQSGSYYVYNGVMVYVHKIYHPGTKQEVGSSDKKRIYKVHVVYENGTENKNMWAESLITSLYDNSRHGKIVTEPESETTDIFKSTGYVYVVKYAGEDRQLSNLHNLYKIGYAKDVKRRLANTSNEATYLFAPVKLIAKFDVQNLSAKKVEKYLHHVFEDCRLQVDMTAPNGKKIDATEWYVMEFERIEEEINRMVTSLLVG